MKILITSDCFRLGGVVVNAGEVIDCEQDEAIDLISSGRAVKTEAEPIKPVSVTGEESKPAKAKK